MATKKIILNELRSLIKQVVKEDYEPFDSTPMPLDGFHDADSVYLALMKKFKTNKLYDKNENEVNCHFLKGFKYHSVTIDIWGTSRDGEDQRFKANFLTYNDKPIGKVIFEVTWDSKARFSHDSVWLFFSMMGLRTDFI